MVLEGLNHSVITSLTSRQVDYVTCIECCKYYIVPETATCGHTLCHGCWSGRHTCPVCAAPVERKQLKINIRLQSLTEHIHTFGDAFEKLFNIKLAEMQLETDKVIHDTTKHVKDWLADSQNHFSAPLLNSQLSVELPNKVELSASKIQIHTPRETKSKDLSTESTRNDAKKIPAQDDWDKIETLPDSEDPVFKKKQNVLYPTDVDEHEYTTGNPRRSSRKRECKNDTTPQTEENDKHSSKNSSADIDKKSVKTKQNWSNVKRMRKEFSKLNKQNRNKLNVSIEMCKKANSVISKTKAVNTGKEADPYIDDNTPNILEKEPSNKGSEVHSSTEKSILSTKEVNKSNKLSYSNITTNNNINQNNTHEITKESHTNKSVVSKEKSLNNNTPLCNNECNDHIMSNVEPSNVDINVNKMVSENNDIKITQKELDSNAVSINTDDIEISIKIGNTITNILIKKKDHDVKFKVNTDREVQTSLDSVTISTKKDVACSPLSKSVPKDNVDKAIVTTTTQSVPKDNVDKIVVTTTTTQSDPKDDVDKTVVTTTTTQSKSTKKNTESADTATANFEITESVEKELSDLMQCVETNSNKTNVPKDVLEKPIGNAKTPENKETFVKPFENIVFEDEENLNDLDIFGSGSVNEGHVATLKRTKYAHSEILVPTLKSKKSEKYSDKRDREADETEMPRHKKQKMDLEVIQETSTSETKDKDENKDVANDSEHMSYDLIMSQVFANIDADIKGQKDTANKIPEITKQTQEITKIAENRDEIHKDSTEVDNQKHSENIFSALDKDSEPIEVVKGINQNPGPETQDHIKNLLTPGMCRDLSSSAPVCEVSDVEMDLDMGTPVVDPDDSDKSIVEETPQKNISFTKSKQNTVLPTKTTSVINEKQVDKNNKATQVVNNLNDSEMIRSIINISDTEDTSKLKDITILQETNKRSLETPITINKFVNHIQHNSTPVARKSLNFDKEDVEGLEQTLCPSTVNKDTQSVCPTTQEKEILAEVFEHTQVSAKKQALNAPRGKAKQKFFLAGSCLTPLELASVKALCTAHGWTFLDKFSNELTHLVVGVDEENKSQRSVKYMCALAASKWIVSFSWVRQCLATKTVVHESPFEALDACGEPGPRLSRTAGTKLFQGFTFFCMPPFSILDMDNLKFMLEAAGGRVVPAARAVRVLPGAAPALLLAEPEHTQEDRFTYMAMELSIVPVNFEWVLNCLGSYALSSLHELLLCPPLLLPPATNQWPAELLARDYDD